MTWNRTRSPRELAICKSCGFGSNSPYPNPESPMGSNLRSDEVQSPTDKALLPTHVRWNYLDTVEVWRSSRHEPTTYHFETLPPMRLLLVAWRWELTGAGSFAEDDPETHRQLVDTGGVFIRDLHSDPSLRKRPVGQVVFKNDRTRRTAPVPRR